MVGLERAERKEKTLKKSKVDFEALKYNYKVIIKTKNYKNIIIK